MSKNGKTAAKSTERIVWVVRDSKGDCAHALYFREPIKVDGEWLTYGPDGSPAGHICCVTLTPSQSRALCGRGLGLGQMVVVTVEATTEQRRRKSPG